MVELLVSHVFILLHFSDHTGWVSIDEGHLRGVGITGPNRTPDEGTGVRIARVD